MEAVYNDEYFLKHQKHSVQAAREIVPFVIDLIQPKSVVDVGCGTGAWLSVFSECGIDDILGIDGAYINRDLLVIEEHRFMTLDLSKSFRIDRSADLVISLEVAEHLPLESAEAFVGSLVRIAAIVLFSAAIPGQGGSNHLNEQWPDYWANLFDSHGYVVVDCLRERFWLNERIKFWFRQNMLLFVEREFLESHSYLLTSSQATGLLPLSLVHPELYLRKCRKSVD